MSGLMTPQDALRALLADPAHRHAVAHEPRLLDVLQRAARQRAGLRPGPSLLPPDAHVLHLVGRTAKQPELGGQAATQAVVDIVCVLAARQPPAGATPAASYRWEEV